MLLSEKLPQKLTFPFCVTNISERRSVHKTSTQVNVCCPGQLLPHHLPDTATAHSRRFRVQAQEIHNLSYQSINQGSLSTEPNENLFEYKDKIRDILLLI
jgi:hypothetical protein